jgi:hypothetical protein
MPRPFTREDIRPFTREDVQGCLAEYGYTCNPAGIAQPFPVDYVSETEGVAYLDINADAVRKGSEVPDRPVRITIRKTFDGVYTRWTLKSVEELASGVPSKALDRQENTPKISPWPADKDQE